MKVLHFKLMIFMVSFLMMPSPGFSQDKSANEVKFALNRVQSDITVAEEALPDAKTLSDLNKHFQSSWIKEYISVEILTSQKGKMLKALSKNDILSNEQKENIHKADLGSSISVKVHYMPDNTMKDNDPKEINFAFTVDPKSAAMFTGGDQQLKKYIKENGIAKLPSGSLTKDDLVAIKFTINEDGQIMNAHLFESVYQSYKNEKTSDILLKAICNMPAWKPAAYSNGTTVAQNFVLTVGNMESCLINLLNLDTSEANLRE